MKNEIAAAIKEVEFSLTIDIFLPVERHDQLTGTRCKRCRPLSRRRYGAAPKDCIWGLARHRCQ
jgi:hypothetical protein